MFEAQFLGKATPLAEGAGAEISTAPQSARPRPGATVLLDGDNGWRISTIAAVLAQATACGKILSIVRLQSETSPV